MKPFTANFAALYAPWVGTAMQAEEAGDVDDVPLPAARRCGRNALVPYTTPQKLMPKSHSKSS